MGEPEPDPATAARLRRWRGTTVGTLFVGYTGYYVCRSVLPIASPFMIEDPDLGFDEVAYGRLIAVGIYAYALGKLVNGVATEYVGGRAAFLLGMALSAWYVAAFGLAGGLTAFLALWAANRVVQSAGWCAVVQITGRWFPPAVRGTVMGWLCLSYLFGDAVAHVYLGAFAKAGVGSRSLFLLAAGTLGAFALAAVFTLRPGPAAVGLPDPVPSVADGDAPVSLRSRLGPLLAGRAFWLVCLMNAGLTAVRETFNYWTPQYLVKGVGLDPGVAGLLSFVFPAAGAASAVGAGWAADRLGGRFGRVIVPSLAAATVALGLFAAADLRGETGLALGLIAAVALGLMGPYTFCSGALALKLGGRRAAAAATGLIDAVGYLVGAVVSGELAGHLVKHAGFAPLLDVLVGVAAVTLLAAVAYWRHEERADRR